MLPSVESERKWLLDCTFIFVQGYHREEYDVVAEIGMEFESPGYETSDSTLSKMLALLLITGCSFYIAVENDSSHIC